MKVAIITGVAGQDGSYLAELLLKKGYRVIGIKRRSASSSIENILSDSDIVVLQKNYDYLFWSILATGTVVVAMNIVKK